MQTDCEGDDEDPNVEHEQKQKIPSGEWGVLTTFFCNQRISQRDVRTSLEKHLVPLEGVLYQNF